jgi:putative membrane-bound dehydrogenase-like protein
MRCKSTIQRRLRSALLLAVVIASCAPVFAADAGYHVGVARVDITPEYPIRLSGFGFRRSESEGVTQKIWAKALAIAGPDDPHGPAVLVTVDNLGIPDYMTREVASRLQKSANLEAARLSITATHTHTAPMLQGVCPTLFGGPIPADQQQRIDRYTRELTDKLEAVALAALKGMEPGTLEFGTGSVGFAINRRTPGGPVDHDLPVLAARDVNGTLIAIYTSYACHCVTLSNNKISGDWAGYAEALIEANHLGAIALISIGCAGDSNPESNPVGDRADIAQRQGRQVADEVDRLLKQGLARLTEPITTKLSRIDLPFDQPPTLEQFRETAKRDDYNGYHARVQLARLERGEKLQMAVSYPIQTWTFGNQLAMVFLPGEVVVDYSLRLKRDFDRSRLWLNAYSNDAPCYIPSERILKEGGYEGGGAMIFYDRPTRLAPGVEQEIVDEVHRQLPSSFLAPKGTEGVAPRSPEQSRRSIRTKPELELELVAAEPLIASPVAIDWSADGRLWVCEMFDYPTGADGKWAPGGRVKVLEDKDHDGGYDSAATFLENIPFPTGITAWGKGVLVCAAPDILYAQDTDGDGKADKVEKLFTGFATENYQARVNSLSLGLDNWVYGANGLLGGEILAVRNGGAKIDIRNHDFRFRPLTGPMETVTGLTQQGRVRDDWGRWFGCNNSQPLLYYPHEERYLRRNPNAPAPPPVVVPRTDFDGGRVFAISRTLERFNDPGNVNRFTSACGVGLNRDTLLGDAYSNNAFVAEPVHNLVHRMILRGDDGAELVRSRADDEHDSEFLASSDNWFRPVQIRTGPDGALYVVDMYRFLIEHPRWIPAERLAQLDVRAGADRGRIYRIRAKGTALREVRDLTKLSAAEVARCMDSPNSTERDRAHVELMTRGDRAALPALEKLAASASLPQVRLQALCAIDALDALTPTQLVAAMRDSNPHVRQHAVRMCEPLLRKGGTEAAGLVETLLGLSSDRSALVRRQLAMTLGEWNDARAGEALAQSATASLNDPEMRAAVLSSATRHCGAILEAVMASPPDAPGREQWIGPLVATAAASDDAGLLAAALVAVLPAARPQPSESEFAALATLLDSLHREDISIPEYLAHHQDLRDAAPRFTHAIQSARRIAADTASPEGLRAAAVAVLCRGNAPTEELDLLCGLVTSSSSPQHVRAAALTALQRSRSPAIAARLLAKWNEISPAARADVANLLLSRDEWTTALLAAVKMRNVQANEISLTDRQRLAQSTSMQVRQLAAEVLPAPGATNRAAVLERFQSVGAMQGIASRGAELFAKNCATCHALNGIGHEVGPDLVALRNKDADYFVKNILDPSAVVEPRFVNYVIAMRDGRTLSGVIKAETTTSLTLAAGGNAAIENLPRADIRSIRATSVSMMPEGFEASFNAAQMADLVAFLKSGLSPKKIAGNTPRLVESDKEGSLVLNADSAEIYGETIVLEREFGNIGFWQERDDHVVWRIRVDKPADYEVHLDYACASNSAGNRFAIEVGGQTLGADIVATGPDWSRYTHELVGKIHLQAGEQRLIVRPAAPVRGALMDLRAVALVVPGIPPRWAATASQSPAENATMRRR